MATEGQTLAFQLHAIDPDGDALTFSADNLPAGATFNPVTGVFSWTPDLNRADGYDLDFQVTDGQASSGEHIHIDVANAISSRRSCR